MRSVSTKSSSRLRLPPHVLELEPLRLDERIDEIEDVETDPLAVDLREDVADLIQGKLAVQLDVGDLVLLGYFLQVLAKRPRIVGVARRGLGRVGIAGGLRSRCLLAPVRLVALNPVREVPTASSHDREGNMWFWY